MWHQIHGKTNIRVTKALTQHIQELYCLVITLVGMIKKKNRKPSDGNFKILRTYFSNLLKTAQYK